MLISRNRGRVIITVTLVLALLLVGYFGSRWLKRVAYDVVAEELVEVGIFNVSFEGVTLKWFGVDVHSLRFDVEKAGQRQSVSLTGISIRSSLKSIQQRRFQYLGVEELVVVVEKTTSRIVEGRADMRSTDIPIPSDLFLLLPVDRLEIHQYGIQHKDDHWRVHSESGVLLTQNLLLTDFSFFYPELPEIKATLQLNDNNQIIVNLVPSLFNENLPIQPILVRLESQISGQYKQLSTSLTMDVDIKESIDHSAFVQEQIDRLVGKDVNFSKGELKMSADLNVNMEDLTGVKDLPGVKGLSSVKRLLDINVENANEVIAFVQGQGQLKLNDINVTGQGKSVSGLNGELSFDMDDSILSFSTSDMVVEKVVSGIKIDSIDSVFSGVFDTRKQTYQLDIASIDGQLMGGDMSFLPFSVTGPTFNGEFELQLNNIDLDELLKLQSNQDLSGEGRLSGFVQVSVDGGVIEIQDGHFGSKNGHIRYRRNGLADEVSGSGSSNSSAQQQLAFVYDAMEDFQYTSLETGVALKAPDNLYLAIALKGSNPSVEQGQVLYLNLNLEQNIGPLIEAANIDGALQNNLLKQYPNK